MTNQLNRTCFVQQSVSQYYLLLVRKNVYIIVVYLPMTVKFVEVESDNPIRELVAVHIYAPESLTSTAWRIKVDVSVSSGTPSLVH